MKILLDFLPILLFFGTFKYAESHKDWAAAFATEHLGFLVDGGQVLPDRGADGRQKGGGVHRDASLCLGLLNGLGDGVHLPILATPGRQPNPVAVRI